MKNWIANIWEHPRTTATGVLIAVASIAGVLSQQGVTLGHVGGGNTVALAGALATALLGLVARDPSANSASGGNGQNTTKSESGSDTDALSNTAAKSTSGTILRMGVVMALLLPLPLLDGCNGTSVAQNIVNWTPALQSAVASVDSTAALLSPENGKAFAAVTMGFDTASNVLAQQAKAYLANPSDSTLANLQTQVVTFQQQVNASLLMAAGIADTANRQRALVAVQAVATAVTAILALVQSISSGKAVAEMAATATIKIAQVDPLISREATIRTVAEHYAETDDDGSDAGGTSPHGGDSSWLLSIACRRSVYLRPRKSSHVVRIRCPPSHSSC